ncbi:MAG: DNA polymerase III subunit beta [Halobacteriovoraceae bacterium]|nr:DNA polymerase III subunit beta [Halobacteriovoraceae bacterium]
MKISIENNLLKESLNKILPVIDRKSSRPILANFYLSAMNGVLDLQGTDLEVSTKMLIECDTEEKGSFCINAKNFSDIIRELPEGLTSLELAENNLLHIKNKSIHFSLLTISSEDYPSVNFEIPDNALTIESESISTLINKTSFAMSTDETRMMLNGLYLQSIDETLRVVAIDGHRLAMLDSNDLNGKSDYLKDGVIIPRKGVYEIKKLAESNPGSKIKIHFDDSFVYFQMNDTHFLSIRLIAREYPKYQTVIPNKTVGSMVFRKEELSNAVKRIRLLANEKTHGIKFHIDNNKMQVSAQHPTLGKAMEEIDIDYQGEVLEIGFNAKYVLESLNVFEEEELNLEFNNSLSPVILKSNQTPDFLTVIMPLRV